jgi:hypothetical protein
MIICYNNILTGGRGKAARSMSPSSGERARGGGATSPVMSPSVLDKHIKSILDEKHAHAHNAHKVLYCQRVCRAKQ